ncbi:GNAT family N-acetyltransferase [Rubellimicrobium aerolatum]|uniref:GNAT family N-acetyltransferase n=1 Tax=Rubellimicrobium aerolatum TaxID=490979 RepID=A0ABW0SFJ1_9RHOB|nr:GNAT family N-acetyltransferase [Rubellimicrobium aerolatum]MBP1807200.1 ribosomal protein S18 acetylase RimI-like enzyme [Rubellimicrobium aerolatum]
MQIAKGFAPTDRPVIAALYWEAFGHKLGRALGPPDRALRFIETVLSPDHAVCAWDDDGRLLGVAGFKTHEGALVGGGFAEMARVYGRAGALWRILLLALLSRDTENVRFLMDGLFVAPQARGRGVGTRLLDAIAAEARARGYQEVRLDVVDGNARARALYERLGYRAVARHSTGLLRYVFRFRAATTMVLRVG